MRFEAGQRLFADDRDTPQTNAVSSRDEHLQAIARDGYTILENVVDPAWMDAITDAIASVGRAEKIAPATNEFEGVLDRGCLVSTSSSIDIGP